MDESLASRILAKVAIAILVVALVDLLYLNYWVVKTENLKPKVENLDKRKVSATEALTPSPTAAATPMATGEPTSEVKTVEKTVVEKQTQTIVQTAQKEIFIPIGSGSTFANSYTDLAGLEVTVDTSKYSAIESVVFEASIWVQDGNGKMFTQLYNKTDGHPVWNSELATSSATGTLTSSTKIVLDNGAKTYKVQSKTNLTTYAAHVENARIKITLK